MALIFQDTELMELMQSFHKLTGIRIILFDENYTELLSYPPSEETFCACMRKNPEFNEKCVACDKQAMDRSKKNNELYIYKCHAGFIEATTPVSESGRIIGYMMLGQITDNKNKEEFFNSLRHLADKYGITEDIENRISKIKYRSESQIHAAAKILDACTGYIQLKEYVHPSGKELIDSIGQFVEQHISEEINVERLCREFHISRTRLYDLTRQYTDGGISAFIQKKRLKYAKKLLKTTDMSVAEISDAVGFSDYNYFLRVFKKEYGISSGKMRK